MNTIEAAAMRAIRFYYDAHRVARKVEPLVGPCECDGCRHARILASLLGVEL